ncbi:hypothetical protein APR08_005106 [Nocardia amikacinitolerans]|nr:hypothetical protein [Nocardia amikacinitolerans]
MPAVAQHAAPPTPAAQITAPLERLRRRAVPLNAIRRLRRGRRGWSRVLRKRRRASPLNVIRSRAAQRHPDRLARRQAVARQAAPRQRVDHVSVRTPTGDSGAAQRKQRSCRAEAPWPRDADARPCAAETRRSRGRGCRAVAQQAVPRRQRRASRLRSNAYAGGLCRSTQAEDVRCSSTPTGWRDARPLHSTRHHPRLPCKSGSARTPTPEGGAAQRTWRPCAAGGTKSTPRGSRLCSQAWRVARSARGVVGGAGGDCGVVVARDDLDVVGEGV